MIPTRQHVLVSKVCGKMSEDGDADDAAPAAEDEPSILDSLSALPAELLDKIKGMTMMDATELIKKVDSTFGVGDSKTEEEESAEESAEE